MVIGGYSSTCDQFGETEVIFYSVNGLNEFSLV